MTNRSFLYVPGDRPDRVAKAMASSADAVIVDLEDAVKPDRKDDARAVVRACAARTTGEVWVRVGSGDDLPRDLAAVGVAASAGTVHGVVVAKCETIAVLDHVVAALGSGVAVAALIESARAVRRLDDLVAHPAVVQCHLGEVDLLAELGAHGDGGEDLLGHVRAELVLASVAAGCLAPIGGVHLAVDDLDALARTSRRLAESGFAGRAVIHPTHCDPVHTAFGPTAAEVAWARDVLDRWDAATDGAIRAADGTMIDEAVVVRARRIVDSVR
jgi:citrate lyase subunit beta/citryl-CoA lyase